MYSYLYFTIPSVNIEKTLIRGATTPEPLKFAAFKVIPDHMVHNSTDCLLSTRPKDFGNFLVRDNIFSIEIPNLQADEDTLILTHCLFTK